MLYKIEEAIVKPYDREGRRQTHTYTGRVNTSRNTKNHREVKVNSKDKPITAGISERGWF